MAIFKKRNDAAMEQYIDEILGWQEEEIVIAGGRECRMHYANGAAVRRLGIGIDSARSCEKGYSGKFEGLCKRCPMKLELEGNNPTVFEIEDAKGAAVSVRARKIRWIDDSEAVMLVLRDMTEVRKTEAHLYNLAYIDQLTGVPNRRKFTEDYNAIADDVSSGKLSGAVAMFDLDNFKTINDTYGHNTGDVMLRRLTEHISSIAEISGKLYRLGGDEFVVLIHEKTDSLERFENMVERYVRTFSLALREYTIPNIEHSCTLSMGVSFFPRHGSGVSELLRKADIALYEAKDAGRNRLTVFEDKYDKAKKLKDLYINIQPILMSAGKTYGYELVDRGDGEESDTGVVNMTEFNRTLDALGLEDITDSARYFINYTDQLLNPLVLSTIPADKFIIQLHVPSQMTKQDAERILALRKNKYSIAFTGVSSRYVTKEMIAYADFCKFDKADINTIMQSRIISANENVSFIATEVDSPEDFQKAKKAGYRLFQGFYFSVPPVVTKKTKDLDPISANYYRLLQLTSTSDFVDFKEISDIIAADVALSYKLLRLLNSAAVGLRNVSSISMAVAYLGEESLKKWIGLLALRGIAGEKPIELVRMSLIRARFGEIMAPQLKNRKAARHIFLLGMLSLLHIAMEMTKEELLEDIPVADEIRESLLTKNGPYSSIVQFYEDYEHGNWDSVSRFAEEQEITSQFISDSFIEAVKWYSELTASSND